MAVDNVVVEGAHSSRLMLVPRQGALILVQVEKVNKECMCQF